LDLVPISPLAANLQFGGDDNMALRTTPCGRCPMFSHILLPTDGSSLSDTAVQKGIQLAKSMHARITGLCVLPRQRYFSYDSELSVEVRKQIAAACQAEVEKHLSLIDTKAREAGVPCRTVCEANDRPYTAIVEAAEKEGCDLIVMASHGRRGIDGLLLGSETQKVLTHSKIPVLVYR
jgi:nucleotide-binding universal stress UspA family protein